MNFLLSNGHSNARQYTLGQAWAEVEMTTRRRNREIAAQASLDKTVHGAIHGGKKGHTLLKETLKGLTDGGIA